MKAVDKFSKDQNAIDLVQLHKRVTNILIKNKHEKIPDKANNSEMTRDYEINLHKSNATLYLINKKAHLSKNYDNTLSTLAGDFLAPSLLSSIDHGTGMVSCLNNVPIDLVCFGNHECDVPHESLKRRIDEFQGDWINRYD